MIDDKETLKNIFKEYLKENLTLNCSTSEYYVGDLGGGSLYKSSHKLELCLEEEIICTTYLD